MPQFDFGTFASQIFWLVVVFTLLFLILSRSVLPKVSGILEQRQRRLDDDIAKAGSLRKEAEAVLADYERTRAEAEARAQAAMRAVLDETAADVSRSHGDMDRKNAKLIAEAEARIAQARKDATAGIHQAAAEVASAATERLIGVKPDDKASAAAVTQVAGG
ncbi:MAG: hypothetical protein QNJ30_03915 [Kiloniellales bacterium]|nr:hypothetical protein [Kiloniellales bacterium]